MRFAGRHPETDVSPGAWIAQALDGQRWPALASLVPASFAAHARVLHPAWRYAGDDDVEVSWAEVAAHNGTVAHPHMAWVGITGAWEYARDEDNQPPVWDRAPDEGHLSTTLADRLIAVLGRHTSTPDDCWFGLWDQYGLAQAGAATLDLPERTHVLVRGPITLAAANMVPEPSEQSASLWWPADRAWCVATDIDLMSTYVGGSAECVADLLDHPGLEAVPARPHDSVGYGEDPLNPVPERG